MTAPRRARFAAALLFAASLVIPFAVRSSAHIRVLTAPGTPVTLTLDHRGGKIRRAFVGTPGGVLTLEQIEGSRIVSDSWRLLHPGQGGAGALLWRIELEEPKTSKRHCLWITSVDDSRSAWFALAPTGPTYWDNLQLPDTEGGVFLYVSPSLPGYCGHEERAGPETLSFVYAMTITRDGPNLVPAPAVYKKLLALARLFCGAQEGEAAAACAELCSDFDRMSKGTLPSRAALEAFSWRRILTVRWGRPR